MLDQPDGLLPETRASISAKLHRVMHEMASARLSGDLERRDLEDARTQLRGAIAQRKSAAINDKSRSPR
jgi:hypothetical protein